jgi:hypothetical protein
MVERIGESRWKDIRIQNDTQSACADGKGTVVCEGEE